jgi:hypothetical protein
LVYIGCKLSGHQTPGLRDVNPFRNACEVLFPRARGGAC